MPPPSGCIREPQFPGLGKGEASCIRATANLLKRRRDCPLLIDDREARRVGASLMIPVTGTAAVIGTAKQTGLIASARAVFDQLLQSGFRISPAIVDAILRENPRRRDMSSLVRSGPGPITS